jgi:hypothetical protein
MKKQEVEDLQKLITEIKTISDKLDYNTSSAINQRVVKIIPILNTELARLDSSGVEVNCPKILIFTNSDAKQSKMTVQDYMNQKLSELVLNDYIILDYGKLDEEYADDNTRIIYMFIKYTN